MVLGRVSTQTIAGSIANPEEFQDNPMIYGERGGEGGRERGSEGGSEAWG